MRKINRIDKPLSKLIKRQRENIQINKVRIEKGDITAETREIQRIIRSHYKNLHSKKLGNVKVMDRCNLPKLNQDQVDNLNRPITCKEIEAVIKSLPIRKKPRARWF